MSLVGIDIGTTGTKAVAFDLSGNALTMAYQEYQTVFAEGGVAELDTKEVIYACENVLAQIARQVTYDTVTAIGISSQGEAFTPVSQDGDYLCRAMVSSDSRAKDLVRKWAEAFGQDRLYSITGHTAYSMYSLFKLLWLKQHRPQVWAKAWKFLFFEDLLIYHLTGEAVTDYSIAARSMLFDVEKRDWSLTILNELGISKDRLADPRPSGTVAGRIKPEMAEKLGFSHDVQIVTGGHDQACGALGCGVLKPGVGAYSIGTVECICPAFENLILTPELQKYNLATYPHTFPGLYATVAFNITGGSVLKWFRNVIAKDETEIAGKTGADVFDVIIKRASDAPTDLLTLPYFGPTGTPYFDVNALGAILGLKLSTTRAELIRAMLEGITYEMKLNLQLLKDSKIEIHQLRVTGGGAKNAKLMQIKADILGLPIIRLNVTEAACAGAALLAGAGTGVLSLKEIGGEWSSVDRVFEPQAENTKRYEERFAVYRKLYPALKDISHDINDFNK